MNFLERNAGVLAAVAIVIAIGGYFYPQVSQRLGAIIDTSYFDYFDAKLGFKIAGTSVLSSTAFTLNGLTLTPSGTSSLNQASTTICSLQSPAATSTLIAAKVTLTVSSTTASIVTLAKGTNTNASTTLLVAALIAANAQGTVVASSTPTGATLDGTNTFAPNQYLNISMAGGTGTFSPTGSCSALWMQ